MDKQIEEYGFQQMEVWIESLIFSSRVFTFMENLYSQERTEGILTKIEQAAMDIPGKIAFGRTMGFGKDYLDAIQQAERELLMVLSYLHLLHIQKWIGAYGLDVLERKSTGLARKMKSLARIIKRLIDQRA